MKNSNSLKTMWSAPLLAMALLAGAPSQVLAQTFSPPKEAKVFAYVEQMPQFKGGEAQMLKFLSSNINYPSDARSKGIEGLVVASFVVERDGAIQEAKILKPLGHGTDEEALRVVKLMNGHWTPGTQKGELVRVQYTLPIRFSLSESERAATAEVANRMPQFKGGPEAMHQTMLNHLALPAEAKQENLNARVVVKFYVDQKGAVSNIRLEGTKLKKTVGPGSELDYMDASTFQLQNKAILAKLSESAISAVKATSGNWEPALKNGQPTGSELVLPVQFFGSENTGNQQAVPVPTMTKYTKSFYKADEVDMKPSFKDGSFEKYLSKNLLYPANAEFEGIVEVNMIIKEDGKVISMIPVSVGKEIHDQVSGAIQKTQGMWNPGKVDGQPVTVTHKLTILFVTDDGSKKPADPNVKKADLVITRYK